MNERTKMHSLFFRLDIGDKKTAYSMKNEDTLVSALLVGWWAVWEEIIDVGRVVTRLLSLQQKLSQDAQETNSKLKRGAQREELGFKQRKSSSKSIFPIQFPFV